MGFEVEPKTELEPWAREALEQQEAAPPPPEFEYVLSPLALEYDRQTKIADHVAYINSHPELRDKILIGAAEFDPQLAEEVGAALVGAAPAVVDVAAQAPESAPPEQASPDAQVQQFEYVLSPLALEYDRGQKIIDHADFIRNNPALRDAVLAGAAEFDPQLAEEVRTTLAQSAPVVDEAEAEATPPEAVEHATKEAVPEPLVAGGGALAAPEAAAKPEPGWVTRARHWHEREPEQAAQFNELTQSSCLDKHYNLDPYLVAKWQQENGIPPDGRVGNSTVAAAVKAAPLTYDDAAVMIEEEIDEEMDNPLDPKNAF